MSSPASIVPRSVVRRRPGENRDRGRASQSKQGAEANFHIREIVQRRPQAKFGAECDAGPWSFEGEVLRAFVWEQKPYGGVERGDKNLENP